MDFIYKNADFVSLHTPLTTETKDLLNTFHSLTSLINHFSLLIQQEVIQ